ncbi:gamma-aminobutyrate transaminase POP2 [Cucumis melo var. makuwa]|uniref:Gamma-aminobutyrate transaminase POP2 n=1 Tax=Cucumis melo var. makuwa TaxID=1194695 RepID=A0A5D3CBH9_CUCMM|nr:gamma-aminobutyrate transaminase POP2 [Cucumis melo var. makuwa]
MLDIFKEFWNNCHMHFKKYNDLKEASANPKHILVGRDEDWYYLCDNYMSRAFQASEDAHNSSPSQPQRVLSYSLGTRYGRRYWVDDQATQKALVGDPSPRPARRPVQAVPRPHVCNPW